MIEMINKLFGDTLWIYTGILGSLFGAAFLAYFKDTKAGLWCYRQFDKLIDKIRDREVPYFSTAGQGKFLDQTVFSKKSNGLFLDIGTHNGINRSNTLHF